MLRIDPLTETGAFDTEFFASDEYGSHRNLVERYLENEGFDFLTEPIAIQIGDHWWNVWSVANKNF